MKLFIGLCVLHLLTLPAQAQRKVNTDSVAQAYRGALDLLDQLVRQNAPESFKQAVFITENVYLGNSLDYAAFCDKIGQMTVLMKAWMKSNSLSNYRFEDSLNFEKNFAIFTIMKDSISVLNPDKGQLFSTIPMIYDFDDYEGAKDWTKMFVSKLLFTYSGNCHSLPYLYKILADQLGATSWISLAPNHLYIQNRSKKIGWYNTELTSGSFPTDGWIMASGYLPLKAVQSGIYMDTLSNQQSIALCMLDLAKGYEHKTHNYYDGFILACCDSSLQYFPLNVQALLLKAETLKRLYEQQLLHNSTAAKDTYQKMDALYFRLFDLGYREMPPKMYQDWLQSVLKEKSKYQNKRVSDALPSKAR